MIYQGQIKNGRIVLDDAVALPEGARVEVVLLAETERNHAAPLYERLKPVFGILNDFPRDGARNLDHYLYGTETA